MLGAMLCDISFEDGIQKGTGRPYGSGLLNKPQRAVFAWPLLSSDTVGTSRNNITHTMPVPEKSEGHFVFPRPRASPHPLQTLNTTKARRHNYDVPQRQQALLVS